MNINIKGTQIDLTPELRSYIMEKFGALQRFFPDVDEDAILADIEVGKPSGHHRKGDVYICKINLEIDGEMLRAEESRETPQEAIDMVKDEIERRVRKLKAKRRDKFLRRARKAARRMKGWRFFGRGE